VIAMTPDTSASPERESEIAVNNGARVIVIVVGLDGSPTSWDAFAWAAGAAARGNGRLVVVHVMPLTEPAVFDAPFDYAGVQAARQQIASELKDEAEQRADELGVPVTFVIEHGEVTHAVIEVARTMHADLVVVGRSAKKLHKLGGSLSHRLTCRNDTPVVVVVP
jgi:nucleotide-binding universal stress UspA family protein